MFTKLDEEFKEFVGDVEMKLLHEYERSDNIISDELAEHIRHQPYITHINATPFIVEEVKSGQIVWHQYGEIPLKNKLHDKSKDRIKKHMLGRDYVPIYNSRHSPNLISDWEYQQIGSKRDSLVEIDGFIYRIYTKKVSPTSNGIMYIKKYIEPLIF